MNWLEKLFESARLPPKTLAKILAGSVAFLLFSRGLLSRLGAGHIPDGWYQVALALALLSAALLLVEGGDYLLERRRTKRKKDAVEELQLARLRSLTSTERLRLADFLLRYGRAMKADADDCELLSLEQMGLVARLTQTPDPNGCLVWEVAEDIWARIKEDPALVDRCFTAVSVANAKAGP